VAEGGALFVGRGCTACHTFGGQHTAAVLPAAPDLAFARERLSPDMAVAWILDPKSVAPTATMPTMGLSEAEALAVRDYLWLTEPGGAAPPDPLPLPPPLDRPVFGLKCSPRSSARSAPIAT
jgi:mono/diheme cytochrome c family protein